MADILETVAARLSEAFGNDTQEVTARKLNTTQGNVSKWITGQQMPTSDFLIEIAKAYDVSIDWLLGLSEVKDVDGVSLEKLTYEQAARVIDYLIKMGTVEVPDLNELSSSVDPEGNYKAIVDELDEGTEDETKPRPVYDSDLLRVNDRALSHILRRRLKMYEIGEDYADLWRENTLPVFKGVRVVVNSENLRSVLDNKNWPTFKDGDWVSTIEELSKLTEEELRELAEKIMKKEKEGKDNGRQ